MRCCSRRSLGACAPLSPRASCRPAASRFLRLLCVSALFVRGAPHTNAANPHISTAGRMRGAGRRGPLRMCGLALNRPGTPKTPGYTAIAVASSVFGVPQWWGVARGVGWRARWWRGRGGVRARASRFLRLVCGLASFVCGRAHTNDANPHTSRAERRAPAHPARYSSGTSTGVSLLSRSPLKKPRERGLSAHAPMSTNPKASAPTPITNAPPMPSSTVYP